MPLPFFSSDGIFGGAYTRVRGLFLSGNLGTTNAGPIESPGGVALIQPALVCSAAGAAAQLLSTVQASIAAANYIYIPQTTGGIATTSFAAAEAAPPQSGMGAALVWIGVAKKLAIYSTASGSGTWFMSAALTSSA